MARVGPPYELLDFYPRAMSGDRPLLHLHLYFHSLLSVPPPPPPASCCQMVARQRIEHEEAEAASPLSSEKPQWETQPAIGVDDILNGFDVSSGAAAAATTPKRRTAPLPDSRPDSVVGVNDLDARHYQRSELGAASAAGYEDSAEPVMKLRPGSACSVGEGRGPETWEDTLREYLGGMRQYANISEVLCPVLFSQTVRPAHPTEPRTFVNDDVSQ